MSRKKNWITRKKETARNELKRELLEHGDLYCAAYVLRIEGLPKPYRFNNTVWAASEDEGLTQIKDNVRSVADDLRNQHNLPEITRVQASMEAGGLVRRMCQCEQKSEEKWQALGITGTTAVGKDEETARLALVYTILDEMIRKSRVRNVLKKELERAKQGVE